MKEIVEFFKQILHSIESETKNNVSNVNPTEIFNEGWMTRLLVHQSIKEKIKIDGLIDFSKVKNWSSEGLISSPFVKTKKNKEGYTHTDIALGDFTINYENRGDIIVAKKATTFGIIEAKMKSNLSQRTTNALNYNQASRNLACIAENVKNESCQTFFTVVAPRKMIDKHDIKSQVERDKIIHQISNRYKLSELTVDMELINRAKKCNIKVLSYEDWIDLLSDKNKGVINKFYMNCLKWNRVK
ncbi:hypothetical protein [uncultured Kordia sp.]|uniref:hypothetical protein n=1 Tax=uncultured Kordia sp. TaxID=507699 RepID=UPI002603FF3A|nr:hypothetical protein [uncultured Kordia sp.]